MNDHRDWEELIDRWLHGELNEAEMERLAERLDSDPAARREFVEQARWDAALSESLRGGDEPKLVKTTRTPRAWGSAWTGALLAAAAVVIALLTAGLYWGKSDSEPKIVKITGLSGALQWTGDGGRVVRNLQAGDQLAGGTVEGLAPGSWIELEFQDRSQVTISGNATLTFSERGQKDLYLKEGVFSANVQPQPTGRPMLLRTRTAALEVVGTRFNVEARMFFTTLNVSEGKVRIKRLSDGGQVDVPAGHRVVAAADRELALTPVPRSATRWKSRLHLGADGSLGKWLPGVGKKDALLQAVPFTTEQGATIYAASLSVSSGDKPPVVLRRTSQIRVRGVMKTACETYFGVTVRRANGDFAGRFQTKWPAKSFQDGQEFEVVLHLQDYRPDPSLWFIQHRLPSEPHGLIVGDIWCHSLYCPAELAVSEVELTAAGEP